MSDTASNERLEKPCACCGQPATGEEDLCPVCATELDAGTTAPVETLGVPEEVTPADSGGVAALLAGISRLMEPGQSQPAGAPSTELVDLSKLEDAFTLDNGFSQPDWKAITAFVERTVLPEGEDQAWRDVVSQWLGQLRSDLGGDYRPYESHRFIVLSCLSPRESGLVLRFAEHALDVIGQQLGDLAWKIKGAKYPLLIFEDQDDYYSYLLHFHPDGTHASSGGACLSTGYVHIAAPHRNLTDAKAMLAHELTHACVAHLSLPNWLNEGLAVTLEKATVGGREFIVDHELVLRHQTFWNRESIQRFWAGTSIDVPGESNELTYSLAEIFVHLLANDRPAFLDFVQTADASDAGQTAALECLDTDLGDVACEFLGPGEWRPNRKAIADCWKSAGWVQQEAPPKLNE